MVLGNIYAQKNIAVFFVLMIDSNVLRLKQHSSIIN